MVENPPRRLRGMATDAVAGLPLDPAGGDRPVGMRRREPDRLLAGRHDLDAAGHDAVEGVGDRQRDAARLGGRAGSRRQLIEAEVEPAHGPAEVGLLLGQHHALERRAPGHLPLLKVLFVVGHVDVEPARRDHAAVVHRVFGGGPQADALVGPREVGKLESARLPHHLLGGRQPPLEIGNEAANRGRVGSLMKASHGDVDRVHRPAAHHLHDPVAERLEPEAPLDELGGHFREREATLMAQEVGRVEEMDVERVALDPLATVEQPPQGLDGRRDRDAERLLGRLAGAHLVGHGADPADPGHEVGQFADRATLHELLEEPRRLVDRELRDLDPPVGHPHPQRPLPLDAGQGVDRDRAHHGVTHEGLASRRSLSARNAGA